MIRILHKEMSVNAIFWKIEENKVTKAVGENLLT